MPSEPTAKLHIHMIWTIGVLVAIIIGLLSAKLGTNDSVKDILNFAVALASLVLALVAIFQAIVSGAALNASIASVRDAADQITQPSKDILEAARNLGSYSERINARAEEIGKHISAVNPQTTVPALTEGTREDRTFATRLIKQATFGGALALYTCARSYETDKSFDPLTLFSEVSMGRYVQGFISCLNATETIEIERSSGDALKVVDLKSLAWLSQNKEAIAATTTNPETFATFKAKVDEYFPIAEGR